LLRGAPFGFSLGRERFKIALDVWALKIRPASVKGVMLLGEPFLGGLLGGLLGGRRHSPFPFVAKTPV
jgi:hypothetical protein